MKAIISLVLVIAVLVTACILSLVIFEIFTFDQGIGYISKTLAALTLLGISSAAIAFFINKSDSSEE